MTKLIKLKSEIEKKIQDTYESGVGMQDAERLSAEFLHFMMTLSTMLSVTSLDARMKKSGVKAIRSAVYLEEVSKSEKKPTEAMLTAILDTNDIISGEQKLLDSAEVETEELKRLYDICNNCHIYYRNIGKGM